MMVFSDTSICQRRKTWRSNTWPRERDLPLESSCLYPRGQGHALQKGPAGPIQTVHYSQSCCWWKGRQAVILLSPVYSQHLVILLSKFIVTYCRAFPSLTVSFLGFGKNVQTDLYSCGPLVLEAMHRMATGDSSSVSTSVLNPSTVRTIVNWIVSMKQSAAWPTDVKPTTNALPRTRFVAEWLHTPGGYWLGDCKNTIINPVAGVHSPAYRCEAYHQRHVFPGPGLSLSDYIRRGGIDLAIAGVRLLPLLQESSPTPEEVNLMKIESEEQAENDSLVFKNCTSQSAKVCRSNDTLTVTHWIADVFTVNPVSAGKTILRRREHTIEMDSGAVRCKISRVSGWNDTRHRLRISSDRQHSICHPHRCRVCSQDRIDWGRRIPLSRLLYFWQQPGIGPGLHQVWCEDWPSTHKNSGYAQL